MCSLDVDRYPGARPFTDTPEDRALFFGRDAEVASLYNRIRATSLLVVFGKSGLGKTSILQAGVFPRLRQRAMLPLAVRIGQGGNILDLVLSAASAASEDPEIDFVAGEGSTLWEFFKTAMFWRRQELLVPVLVFDQFEEIFSLQSAEQRGALARELGSLVSDTIPPSVRERRRNAPAAEKLSEAAPDVKVVLSLREEYLGSLQELSLEVPAIFQERVRLIPLGEAQAREAIRQPAMLEHLPSDDGEMKGFATPRFEYEEETLAHMLDFLKGRSDYVEPFQLQILCRHVELVVAGSRRDTAQPIRVGLRDIGGLHGMERVVREFYDQAIKALPRLEQRRARDLCEDALLTRDGHRLSLQENQIRKDHRLGKASLDKLVEARLLRKELRLESFFYELSHDSLAQPIQSARPWWRLPKKHRLPVAIVAAALLSLIAAQVIYLKRAEKARRRSEELVGFLIGEEFLERLRPFGQLKVLEQVQQRVEDYYSKLPEGAWGPTSYRNRALTHKNKSQILMDKGLFDEASRELELAVGILEWLLERDGSDPELHLELANTLVDLGYVRGEQGSLPETLETCQRALDQVKRLAEPEDRKALAEPEVRKALAEPEVRKAMSAQAQAHQCIATAFYDQGRLPESLQHAGFAMELARKIQKTAPDEVTGRRVLRDALWTRGQVQEVWDRDAAQRDFEEFRRIAEDWARRDPVDVRAQYFQAIAIFGIATLAQSPDDLTKYEKMLKTFESLIARDPANVRWQRDLAVIKLQIGYARLLAQEWDEALTLDRESEKELRKLTDESKNAVWLADLSRAYQQLGEAYTESGRDLDAAFENYEKSRKIAEGLTQLDPTNASWWSQLLWVHLDVALALAKSGKHEEARESVRRAISVGQSMVSQEPGNFNAMYALHIAYVTLGNVLSQGGEEGFEESVKSILAALPALEEAVELEPDSAVVWGSLYYAHFRIGTIQEDDRALAEYREALRACSKAIELEPGNWSHHNYLYLIGYHIGLLLESKGDLEGALSEYRAARPAIKRAVELAPDMAFLRNNLYKLHLTLGDFLKEQDDFDGALKEYHEALAAIRKAVELDPGSFRRSLYEIHAEIGWVLVEQDDLAGALRELGLGLETIDSLGAAEEVPWRQQLKEALERAAEAADQRPGGPPTQLADRLDHAIDLLRELEANGGLSDAGRSLLEDLVEIRESLPESLTGTTRE